MKMVLRILLGLAGLLALLIVILAGVIAWDVNLGTAAAPHTNVTYTNADGIELQGYLAQPEGEGPFPAVLMLHEWWGLTGEIPHLADALAEEGYVVLAPDVYRDRVATTVPGALWMRLTTPNEPIWADTDAGLAYLQGLSSVDSARIAPVGFCFGGQQSLQLALRQPNALAASVIFYGTLETDPAILGALQPAEPILGIFGAEDASIPLSEVNAFEQGLAQANVTHTVSIYDGVGHAFVTAENYNEEGASGEAWSQMVAFLNEAMAQ